jgi:hypothetical protein
MGRENAFSDWNGNSTFSSRKAASPTKLAIWNEGPLMGSEICLRAEPHLYVSLAAVY